MLNKQKRKHLIRLIQSFRVKILDTEICEGMCRELDIGSIWVIASHEGEAWVFDYHESSYSIMMIGPALALIDNDGGCEAAWEVVEEIFSKFHESNQNTLGERKIIKKVFGKFIKKLAESDEGYVYFLQKLGDDNIYKYRTVKILS